MSNNVNERIIEQLSDDEGGVLEYTQAEESKPIPQEKLADIIECMLFVASEPLNIEQIEKFVCVDTQACIDAVDLLDRRLQASSGLQLMRVAGGLMLCTKPEYAEYCSMVLQPSQRKLSKAGLETLAIVAYRQPCTVPEIDAVRGVSSGGVVKTLLERGLIREAGKKHAPGRPTLFATTEEFLHYFGLNDISELPDIDELAIEEVKALEAQKELFESGKELHLTNG